MTLTPGFVHRARARTALAVAVVVALVRGSTTARAALVVEHATATGANQPVNTGSASLASFTVADNPDRLLVVAVGGEYNTNATTVSSVTFAGQPLIKAGEAIQTPTAASLWYLLNPPATTGSVVVTMSGNTGNGWKFGVGSFYNVQQQAPTDVKTSISAGSTAVGVTLNTGADAFTVESLGSNNDGTTAAGGDAQFEVYDVDDNNGSGGWAHVFAHDTVVPAGTSTQNWTLSPSSRFAFIAASFQGVPEPSAAAAALIAGGVGLGLRRRRRRA